MLVNHIMKIRESYADPDHDYYPRPSAAGPDRCLRSMVYHRLKFPPSPFPGRSLVVMDDSSWHEELTIDLLRKSGVLMIHSEQMEVQCRAPMTVGHIDFMIQTIDGRDILVEHKALNHFSAEGYFERDHLPNDYLHQTACYAEGVAILLGLLDLPCMLLIKNKNTSAYIEFNLIYHLQEDLLEVVDKVRSDGRRVEIGLQIPNIVGSCAAKFQAVEDYATRDIPVIPPRPLGVDRDQFPCSYCRWHGECWKNWKEEIEQLSEGDLSVLEEAVAFREQLKAEAASATKEAERIKTEEILPKLHEMGISRGRAGRWFISLTLQEMTRIDKDLVPDSILPQIQKVTYSEVLRVRDLDKKKAGR